MANLMNRIRELLSAQAHHRLDQIENPQVMAQQLLRDLAADVHDVQRALVGALGLEKQLQRQQAQQRREVEDWERKAEQMLDGGQETLARGAAEKAVQAQVSAEGLARPLESAQRSVARLREQLHRLRTEWESARQRCTQIGAQQTAAEALGVASRAADHYTAAMDRAHRLDELASRAGRYEAEIDAAADLLDEDHRVERDIAAFDRTAAVNSLMQRLKTRAAAASMASAGS